MISAIKQIHIQVFDIERAVKFYQDILGLKLVLSFPEQNMAFFDCNGTRLYLGNNPEYNSNPYIYYDTDNIENDYQLLNSKKVEFIKLPTIIHQTDDNQTWLMAFNDSEGNTLHFMQDKKISGH